MSRLLGFLGFGRARTAATRAKLEAVFPLASHDVGHTYVSRKHVEREVESYLRHGNSIILFSGPSKSGKTVLCKRLAGDQSRAHIHVWRTMSADEFWDSLRLAIEAPSQVETSTSRARVAERLQKVRAGVGVGLTQISSSDEEKTAESNHEGRRQLINADGRVGVINFLLQHPHTIIIDDYHWLNPDLVADIFPPLKQVLGAGSKIILVSVSKGAFPTTGDLGDFTGRLLTAHMPAWEHDEIRQIANMGFRVLNVEVPEETIFHLVNCAYHSPLLMQGLCNQFCYENGILETQTKNVTMPKLDRAAAGALASRFAQPLTIAFDAVLIEPGDKKWRTKDRDKRLLSMTEVFVLSISHKKPFEPTSLEDMVKRARKGILHGEHLPPNLAASLAAKAVEIQVKLGGERGDRSPIYYDGERQEVTIVDPYFKLWARWVRGAELAGKLLD